MYHQLSPSELEKIREDARIAEEGMAWLIRLHSLHDKEDKSNEKGEKSQESVLPCPQCLSA